MYLNRKIAMPTIYTLTEDERIVEAFSSAAVKADEEKEARISSMPLSELFRSPEENEKSTATTESNILMDEDRKISSSVPKRCNTNISKNENCNTSVSKDIENLFGFGDDEESDFHCDNCASEDSCKAVRSLLGNEDSPSSTEKITVENIKSSIATTESHGRKIKITQDEYISTESTDKLLKCPVKVVKNINPEPSEEFKIVLSEDEENVTKSKSIDLPIYLLESEDTCAGKGLGKLKTYARRRSRHEGSTISGIAISKKSKTDLPEDDARINNLQSINLVRNYSEDENTVASKDLHEQVRILFGNEDNTINAVSKRFKIDLSEGEDNDTSVNSSSFVRNFPEIQNSAARYKSTYTISYVSDTADSSEDGNVTERLNIRDQSSSSTVRGLQCLPETCRLCTSTDEQPRISIIHLMEELKEIIPDIVKINGGLPQYVCKVCADKLHSCINIKKGFTSAYDKLRQMQYLLRSCENGIRVKGMEKLDIKSHSDLGVNHKFLEDDFSNIEVRLKNAASDDSETVCPDIVVRSHTVTCDYNEKEHNESICPDTVVRPQTVASDHKGTAFYDETTCPDSEVSPKVVSDHVKIEFNKTTCPDTIVRPQIVASDHKGTAFYDKTTCLDSEVSPKVVCNHDKIEFYETICSDKEVRQQSAVYDYNENTSPNTVDRLQIADYDCNQTELHKESAIPDTEVRPQIATYNHNETELHNECTSTVAEDRPQIAYDHYKIELHNVSISQGTEARPQIATYNHNETELHNEYTSTDSKVRLHIAPYDCNKIELHSVSISQTELHNVSTSSDTTVRSQITAYDCNETELHNESTSPGIVVRPQIATDDYNITELHNASTTPDTEGRSQITSYDYNITELHTVSTSPGTVVRPQSATYDYNITELHNVSTSTDTEPRRQIVPYDYSITELHTVSTSPGTVVRPQSATYDYNITELHNVSTSPDTIVKPQIMAYDCNETKLHDESTDPGTVLRPQSATYDYNITEFHNVSTSTDTELRRQIVPYDYSITELHTVSTSPGIVVRPQSATYDYSITELHNVSTSPDTIVKPQIKAYDCNETELHDESTDPGTVVRPQSATYDYNITELHNASTSADTIVRPQITAYDCNETELHNESTDPDTVVRPQIATYDYNITELHNASADTIVRPQITTYDCNETELHNEFVKCTNIEVRSQTAVSDHSEKEFHNDLDMDVETWIFQHQKMYMFICSACESLFLNKNALKQHRSTVHEDLRCKACNEDFSDEESFKCHELLHKAGKLFTCQICNESLKSKRNLKLHYDTHTTPIVICHCGKKFKTNHHLKRHQVTHNKSLQAQCDICGMHMKKESMISHLRLHTGEKPYICDICGEKFTHIKSWQCHVHNHSGLYECRYCVKKFTTSRGLQLHEENHIPTTKKDFKCPVCLLEFKRAGDRNKHTVQSSCKNFFCVVCRSLFPSLESLVAHQDQEHSKEDVIHTAEKYRKEKERRKGMDITKNLPRNKQVDQRHERDSNGFECPICLSKFKYAHSRKKHVVKVCNHFICVVCRTTFSTIKSLVLHRIQKHSEEVVTQAAEKYRKERLKNCPLCNVVSNGLQNLNRHMLEVHGKLRV